MQLHTHVRERNVHAATHVRERDVHAATHSRQGEECTCRYTRQGEECTCRCTLTPGTEMYMPLHTHAREMEVHAATHSRQGVCAELHAGEGEGCREMHLPWGGMYRTTHSRQGLGCTELHNPQHEKTRTAACTLTSGRGMRRTKLRDTMPWSSARSSCLALTMMKRSVVLTVTSSSRKG